MRDDHPPVGDLRGALRQHRGDVFVGQAVKPVAPHPLLVQRVGQRERLLDLRRGAVKRRVEARDLRQFRVHRQRHADRRQIVRLVQRRQWHQRFQLGEQFRRHPRPAANGAARHARRGDRAPRDAAPPSCSRAQGSIAGSTSLGEAGGSPAKSGGAIALPSGPTACAAGRTPIPSTCPERSRVSPS